MSFYCVSILFCASSFNLFLKNKDVELIKNFECPSQFRSIQMYALSEKSKIIITNVFKLLRLTLTIQISTNDVF